MKVRNKKTGEVFDALVREKGGGGSYSLIVCDIKAYEQSKSSLDEMHFILDEYESLAELNEEWEDYEPKEYWFINSCGVVEVRTEEEQPAVTDMHKQSGNYFETKEEAERAVEKLKAWKRLKDKGFRFESWEWKTQKINYELDFRVLSEEGEKEAEQDLDLLFEGEE